MAIINIGSKNYNYPDEGEKKWGGKLKKVILGLVSYISSSLKRVVLLDSDQTIAGNKIFANAPKVFIGSDGSNKREVRLIHEEEFLANINYSDFELRLNKIEESINSLRDNNIKNIEDVLGVSNKKDMQENLTNQLESSKSEYATKGSPLNLFSPMLEKKDESVGGINVAEALTKLAEICDTIVPIGSIMSFHMLDNFQIAQWVDFDESLHKAEQKLELEEGVYKVLSGGPWALCDGSFILPPNYFGRDQKGKCFVIPDLSDAFMSGYTNDKEYGKVVGLNRRMLTLEQIPDHKHNISHYHKIYAYWTGIDPSSISRNRGRHTFVNHLSRSGSATYGTDRSPWNYGVADLVFHDKDSFIIDTDALSAAIDGRSGSQQAIDVRPKALIVKFFMRIW